MKSKYVAELFVVVVAVALVFVACGRETLEERRWKGIQLKLLGRIA
jgi:hypothetical protein